MSTKPGQAQKHRLDEKAAHATVRQELAILGRMLNLAVRAGKLANRPPLPLVEVRNTRTGFFTTEQLRAVTAALPEHLRPLVQFASITGWRRAECLGLMWNRVDFGHGQVRLEPGTTKNLAGRMWPFGEHPALASVLMEQYEKTQRLQRERGVVIPWVFHRDGKKITDFRDAWMTACKKAGVPGRLFHDLRRTAVRNLIRAGVSDKIAMALGGWKTRSVLDRYNIVSASDLTDGVKRLVTATPQLHSTPSTASAQSEQARKSK